MIENYKVICDETNNSEESIKQGYLKVDIFHEQIPYFILNFVIRKDGSIDYMEDIDYMAEVRKITKISMTKKIDYMGLVYESIGIPYKKPKDTFQISPGVSISEIDHSSIIPADYTKLSTLESVAQYLAQRLQFHTKIYMQWEINDAKTREEMGIILYKELIELQHKRIICDYQVTCSEINNTPTDIDAGFLHTDIHIKSRGKCASISCRRNEVTVAYFNSY